MLKYFKKLLLRIKLRALHCISMFCGFISLIVQIFIISIEMIKYLFYKYKFYKSKFHDEMEMLLKFINIAETYWFLNYYLTKEFWSPDDLNILIKILSKSSDLSYKTRKKINMLKNYRIRADDTIFHPNTKKVVCVGVFLNEEVLKLNKIIIRSYTFYYNMYLKKMEKYIYFFYYLCVYLICIFLFPVVYNFIYTSFNGFGLFNLFISNVM